MGLCDAGHQKMVDIKDWALTLYFCQNAPLPPGQNTTLCALRDLETQSCASAARVLY